MPTCSLGEGTSEEMRQKMEEAGENVVILGAHFTSLYMFASWPRLLCGSEFLVDDV